MNTDVNKNGIAEKEIDLIDLAKKLWVKRKLILKVSSVGLVIGVIIAFSIPKEYTTTVILAPENSANNNLGNAGALAAMAGINLGSSPSADISSDVYPNIMESTPFVLGLSQMTVPNDNHSMTLFNYIKEDQQKAWWSYVFGLPKLALQIFSVDSDGGNSTKDKLSLSKDQIDVIETLRGKLTISIDKKTGIIILNSTMQSPEVSALVADSLINYLQSYIISYRTEKSREDLKFTEKLYLEAKKEYSDAQRKYAQYVDANQNVILASYRVNQEKLQNEVSLTYSVYNQVAQQLQVAKVKVQDQTPVYTIIQPAVIPLIPSKPNKKLIVIGFIFLFGLGASGYILGTDYLKNLKS